MCFVLRSILLLVIVCSSPFVQAQSKLDSRTVPTIGVGGLFSQAIVTGVEVGQPGNNTVWDFRGLIRNNNTNDVPVLFVSPSTLSTLIQSRFPTATVAKQQDTTITLYNTQQTLVRTLGEVTPNTRVEYSESNPFESRPTEIVFTSQFVDGFDFLNVNTRTGGVNNGRGSLNLRYDGFGKLLLPDTAIDSASRIVLSRIKLDTIKRADTVFVVKTTTIEHQWLSKNSPLFWLSIQNQTVTLLWGNVVVGAPVITKNVLYRIKGLPTGIHDQRFQTIRVHQLPAYGDVLHVSNVPAGVATINIVDANGKTCVNEHIIVSNQSNTSSLPLNISSLSNGVYMLVFTTTAGNQHTQPIVIVK